MKLKKEFNIGDSVVTSLRDTNNHKKTIKGKIKDRKIQYGHVTYTITHGIVEDFTTRIVK